jgi:gluconolactonase
VIGQRVTRLAQPFDVEAVRWSRLPDALRHTGEPSEWARMNRPGLRMHSFLEGATFDAQGHLWLVDIPYGRIFRIDANGTWSVVHTYEGNPHCLAHFSDGGVVVTDRRRGLMRLDPAQGTLETICSGVNFENFRALSDVAVAPNGDLWFTDPGRSSPSDPTGRLLRLRRGETSPDIVLANIPYPNSVALDASGRQVFVSVTRANCIWRLLADAPDPVFPMVSTFAHLSGGNGPDGLSIDERGRVAVAQSQAGRAYIFDAMGDLLCRIRTPGGAWTTACTFSPDGRSLYILEAQEGAVYRAELDFLDAEPVTPP